MFDYVKYLIDNGSDLNERADGDKTLLMLAVEKGDLSSVIALLKHGANPFLTDEKGQTALMKAVLFNQDIMVPFLTGAMNGNVNQIDHEGNRAIDLARLNQKEKMVELLSQFAPDQNEEDFLLKEVKKTFESGGDFDKPDEKGISFLAKVIFHKYNKIADYLLNKNVQVNCQCQRGFTPLMMAVASRNEEMIFRLIEKGANPLLKNKLGMTALEMAQNFELKEDVIHFLEKAEKAAVENEFLKEEALDSIVDGVQGYIRLMLAVNSQDKKELDFLIKSGVFVDFKGLKEDTPLMVSLSFDDLEISKMLIEAGANVNTQNFFGETPLMRAVTQESENKIALLIENGADIWMKNKEGVSAIDFAVQQEAYELAGLMKKLYQTRLGLDSFENLLQTIHLDEQLISAVKKGNKKAILKAIEEGADVNILDDAGEPLLFLAFRENRFVAFKTLVDAGANVNKMNTHNQYIYGVILEEDWSFEKKKKWLKALHIKLVLKSKVTSQKRGVGAPSSLKKANERD